ncbi:hypothetical protein Gohar_009096, partial [Gossypium harknessii]|nr:hypothetical protein [Gossypium harknessii]
YLLVASYCSFHEPDILLSLEWPPIVATTASVRHPPFSPFLIYNFSYYKHSVCHYDMDLLSVVHLLVLLMDGTDVHSVKLGPCNGSCIRYSLVKLLRLSGSHINNNNGNSERVIIDIDFRKHSEISSAIDSYDKILDSLRVVYVGSMTQFKQLPQLMVEAARSSLEQNSMMFPLWRPLAYLQAKCYSNTTSTAILLLAIRNAKDI